MPGGGFGGDSSVRWFLGIEDARAGATKVSSLPGNGLYHEGIDEAEGQFTVSIEIPRGDAKAQFLADLKAAVGVVTKKLGTPDKADNARITLRVPIEDRAHGGHFGANLDQIVVSWPSRAVKASAAGRPAAPRIARLKDILALAKKGYG